MAKSYAETLDNVVLGGFNTAKTLINIANSFSKYYAYCNDFEKTLVNASEKVLGIVQNIKDSVYTVTYRIWGEVSSTEALLKEDVLKAMRNSFTYWYPMDLRCSGKDLIGNHLTMSLYNHAAVWNDHNYMVRSYYCNGYILVNGEKMSKRMKIFRKSLAVWIKVLIFAL